MSNGMSTDLRSRLNNAVRIPRMFWRRLTSMRTALILLFLLAVAAVPGSLLPQRPLNSSKTTAYIAQHGAWGRILDRIGMFDVFGSFWFAAIYLLLFVSLVGCLIPRIRVHARAVARKPLKAPRNLERLPESASFETGDSVADYTAVARTTLGRRWRIAQRQEASGAVTLSAEKGYSRETGNLIFHVALLSALILIAVGRLYTYSGSRIVKEGQGFCNVVSQYDEWAPGRLAAEGKVHPAPFCIDDLSKFTASYTKDGEASEFRADIRYRPNLEAKSRKTAITVNHPLRLEGDRVYLINHGYAPSVTIRMPDGSVRHDTEVFLPSDASTYFSEGVYKQPGKVGANQDVGVRAFFAPTPTIGVGGTINSASPKPQDPVLGIFVFEGSLNQTGLPSSVYALDTSKMHKVGAANLRQGQTKKLPNGVQVTFDGWKQWATFQVSHDPAQAYLLIAAVAMVVGLIGSLGVRRRRVWLRFAPKDRDDTQSPTVVSVGGLARSDSGNFTTEFAALVARLEAAGAVPAKQSPIEAGRT
jgi:cytochrome c biogenesis protein